jgi:L-fuculose-phosphate aldolase
VALPWTGIEPHCGLVNARWQHPRDEIVATMDRIYRYRMTTTSGGNLSVRDPQGGLWITPSRVDKGGLQARDVVRVLEDGAAEGLHPPSSELPFHQRIYARRPDIGAIVHAHPSALVAFSIVRQVPETRIQAHAYAVCGRVAMAPYACPGSAALGENIAEAFASGADCVLLENHGVVIGGVDLADAFQRFETLEFVAQTLIFAGSLDRPRALTDGQLGEDRRPSFEAWTDHRPGFRELELRSQLCAFLHRAYQQRLLISTAGAFSARVDAETFVITPSRRDRLEVEASGLVAIRGGKAEAGKLPSRAAELHARIFARHPAVGAVINAQPAHASAYCVAEAAFQSRTIPESYLVLRDVPRLPFKRIVEEADEIADAVSLERNPVVLIENEGAVVLGRDLLEAFDRLEVLEATAEALLNSQAIGPVVEMPDETIGELRRVFGIG